MNDLKTDKKRLTEIDFLRGLAIIAVMTIHTAGFYRLVGSVSKVVTIEVFLDVIFHCGVPLFIFISGLVLAMKYNKILSIRQFYKKRFISILPPYLFFSVIYIFVTYYSSHTIPSTQLIIFNIISANTFYHLWFFLIIFQFYLFYPFIINSYNKISEKYKISYILIIILAFQIISNSVILFNIYAKYIISRLFISWIFFFVLGIYVGKRFYYFKEKITKISNLKLVIPVITIILTTTIISYNVLHWMKYYDYYWIPQPYFIPDQVFGPILYMAIFIIAFKLSEYFLLKKNIISKIVEELGIYSFGIYLIHPFYIVMIMNLLSTGGITVSSWVFLPILLPSTIFLSYITIKLLSYLPYHNYVIGKIEKDISSVK